MGGLQHTCLHYVSDLGNVDFVKLFLQHGGKVNQAGKQQMTPLHLAARKKHIEVVEVLLEAGADIDLTDMAGKRADQYAVRNGSPELAKALTKGAQLSERLELLRTYRKEMEERQRLIKSLEED